MAEFKDILEGVLLITSKVSELKERYTDVRNLQNSFASFPVYVREMKRYEIPKDAELMIQKPVAEFSKAVEMIREMMGRRTGTLEAIFFGDLEKKQFEQHVTKIGQSYNEFVEALKKKPDQDMLLIIKSPDSYFCWRRLGKNTATVREFLENLIDYYVADFIDDKFFGQPESVLEHLIQRIFTDREITSQTFSIFLTRVTSLENTRKYRTKNYPLRRILKKAIANEVKVLEKKKEEAKHLESKKTDERYRPPPRVLPPPEDEQPEKEQPIVPHVDKESEEKYKIPQLLEEKTGAEEVPTNEMSSLVESDGKLNYDLESQLILKHTNAKTNWIAVSEPSLPDSQLLKTADDIMDMYFAVKPLIKEFQIDGKGINSVKNQFKSVELDLKEVRSYWNRYPNLTEPLRADFWLRTLNWAVKHAALSGDSRPSLHEYLYNNFEKHKICLQEHKNQETVKKFLIWLEDKMKEHLVVSCLKLRLNVIAYLEKKKQINYWKGLAQLGAQT